MVALNRYYKITKFYNFLRETAIKGAITIAIFLLIFIIVDYFFLDTRAIFESLVNDYSPKFIFLVFYISETILGLLPPEIFIAWSAKMSNPWLYLTGLASLSYLGGITAYYLGKLTFKIPVVKNYLENKIAIHLVNLRKWGSIFVVVGAMLPLPHSIVSFACGLIKYDFKHYLLWALFRFLRFYIYGVVIFNVI
ncbi:YqaA family protein [Pedobacter alpinus]|uniref:YqaA family protein n=1 Tax=Pedobacter alpinus TaxID=1590643 RepID=A0ABW5TRA5_9SPHI